MCWVQAAIWAVSYGGFNPLLYALTPQHGMNLLKAATPPTKFSGKAGADWELFVREWKNYAKLIEGAFPPHMWDASKLQTLAGLVDSTTKMDLLAKQQANPDLKFEEFWQHLQREFDRDSAHQCKAAWRKVQLHSTNGQITEADWRAFVTEYRAKRTWVNSCTESEETELIFKQLNTYWNQEITKKVARKNSKGYWTQIENTDKHSVQEIEKILRRLGVGFKKVVALEKGFRVQHETETERDSMLRIDGTSVKRGRKWEISRTKIRLTT